MGPLGHVPPAEFEANYHRQRAGQAATVSLKPTGLLETRGDSKSLDLTRTEVLAVEELRRVRNSYVHVRVRERAVTVPTEDMESWGEVHSTASQVLKLSDMPAMWDTSDAKIALHTVESFFRYFFVELLGQSPRQLFDLLATALHLTDGASGRLEDAMLERAVAISASAWSIDFSFLGSQGAAQPIIPEDA